MMSKSFPGWVSSHSTSNLTTGINLPTWEAFNLERSQHQPACTGSTASGPFRRRGDKQAALGGHTVLGVRPRAHRQAGRVQAAVFTSFALHTVMTAVT